MATTNTEAVDDVGRHVTAVFEKFDRDVSECQELLCRASSEWILSSDEAPRHPLPAPAAAPAAAAGGGGVGMSLAEPPPGIISNLTAVSQSRVILLIAADETGFSGDELDMREVH